MTQSQRSRRVNSYVVWEERSMQVQAVDTGLLSLLPHGLERRLERFMIQSQRS